MAGWDERLCRPPCRRSGCAPSSSSHSPPTNWGPPWAMSWLRLSCTILTIPLPLTAHDFRPTADVDRPTPRTDVPRLLRRRRLSGWYRGDQGPAGDPDHRVADDHQPAWQHGRVADRSRAPDVDREDRGKEEETPGV